MNRYVRRSLSVAVAAGCVAALLTTPVLPGARAQERRAGEADRVHFLIVADTKDAKAKAIGLDLDRNRVTAVLRDTMTAAGLEEGPDGRYTVTVLDGDNVTEQAVLDHYRKRRFKATDALVCYFTGHGGFEPEKGHELVMRKGPNLARQELLAAMGRDKPRAVIVLTDCCANASSTVTAGFKIKAPDPAFRQRLTRDGSGEVARDLFFKARGVVNVTAAMTGTIAEGERKKGGSFFTLALDALLREGRAPFDADRDGVVTWAEFFPGLTTLTQLESFVPAKDGARAKFHTPEAFLLGEEVLTGGADVPAGGKAPVLEVAAELAPGPGVEKTAEKKYLKTHAVRMEQGKAYLVSLHSSHFDTFLTVKGGGAAAENDDYGGTTRSRVLYYPTRTGMYDVGVSSFGAGETGRYSLTVQEALFADALSKADKTDRYCLGSYSKRHAVRLRAHRSYSVRLESADAKFDPYLRVIDEYGNTVALNDDEDLRGGRTNSVASFQTQSAGTYFVVATTYNPGQAGRYAVFVQD